MPGCVATWRHWHGGFPGGYDNPDDPDGPPIEFEGEDPEPGVVRDYNGAGAPMNPRDLTEPTYYDEGRRDPPVVTSRAGVRSTSPATPTC